MKVEFSWHFRKIFKYQISWKTFLWEPTCSMRTYGHTDMTKLIVAFHSYGNATTTSLFLPHCVRFACFPHSQQCLVPWCNLHLPLSSALVSSKSTLLLCSEDVSWFPSRFRVIFCTNVHLTFLLFTHSESHAVGGCLCWGCLYFCFLLSIRMLAWF